MAAEKLDVTRVPGEVRALLLRLDQAGGRAWLVGGTVRDLLLGLEPRDFDIATDLPPERIAAVLPAGNLQDQRFGACRIDGLPWPVVVTTLRTESDYRDHRHPAAVAYVTDPLVDAQRRDFTINALYLDGRTGELFDPCGGLDDLRQRRLCTVGEPHQRFLEDALRLLRALRFAARYGLSPTPDLLTAARATAPLLRHLSGERVFAELTNTFTSFGRGAALHALVDWGFAAVLLPEVAAMQGVAQPPQYHPEGCVLTHVALVLEHVPSGAPILSWAALLHDIGKPPTFRVAEDRIRFDGHDVLSARMAEVVLTRLAAPKALRTAVVEICRDHIRMAAIPAMRPRRREQWLRSPLFPLHLMFHRADCLGSHGDLSIHALAEAALQALPPLRPPLLTGADVLALGLSAGPLVGQLLRAVDAELDADAIDPPTRDQALQVLQRLVATGVKDGGLVVDRKTTPGS